MEMWRQIISHPTFFSSNASALHVAKEGVPTWSSFLEQVNSLELENRQGRAILQSPSSQAQAQRSLFIAGLHKLLSQGNGLPTNASTTFSHLFSQTRPGAPAAPLKPVKFDILGSIAGFFNALLRVMFKGVPTLYDSYMNAEYPDLGCYDPLWRYSYASADGAKMFPKTFLRYKKLLKSLVPVVPRGQQCFVPMPDFQPIGGSMDEQLGPMGTLWGGVFGGPGYEDPAGRGWGPNADMPESQFCYTLLETYMRMCAAPERMFFLQMEMEEGGNATARPPVPRNAKVAARVPHDVMLEKAMLRNVTEHRMQRLATWTLEEMMTHSALLLSTATPSDPLGPSKLNASTLAANATMDGAATGPLLALLQTAVETLQPFPGGGAGMSGDDRFNVDSPSILSLLKGRHGSMRGGVLAMATGVGAGTGVRPVAPAPPAVPLKPTKPFIFQLFAGIFEALGQIIVKLIILVLGIICEVVAPIILDILVGGFLPIIFILLPLFLFRFIPLLMDGTLYAQRPVGFSGPDPYDAYGPDSPEPKPFKKPMMEMCYRLLDTWTYKCNTPKEY